MPKQYSRPVKRSPASDPQQYRVYRMESEAIGARNYMQLTRAALERFVRAACRTYGMPKIRIEYLNHRKWAAQAWGNERIQFANKRTSRDLITVAHELAHCLHSHIKPDAELTQQDHGPEFLGCYMSILDVCRIVPVYAMRTICDRYKLRYVDPGLSANGETLARRVRRGY